MKYALILPLLLINWIQISGQNLVPNPGFEELNACPENSGQITNAVPWMNPNLKSPDLYHTCAGAACEAPPFICVPDNWVGNQFPFMGEAYAGIFVGAGNENREYIQVQLESPLTKGHAYILTYYVSLADGYQHAIDRLGVYFSPVAIFEKGQLSFSPQITSPNDLFLTDKNTWIQLTDTLIASGGEVFMTIGNFNDETHTNFIDGQGGERASSYYYIDEVKLIPANSFDIPVTECENCKCAIYFPNVFTPNNDGVNDEFSPFFECEFDEFELMIFDRWGERIFKTNNAGDAWDGTFQGRKMHMGIYLYQLRYASKATNSTLAFGELTLLR